MSATFAAGCLYLLIGLVSAELAGGVPGPRQRFWRGMAWLLSAIVFGVHVARDRIRMRYRATSTAFHAALGTALGAFGLALAATIHGYRVSTPHLRSIQLSLLIWPLITALPAFLVALVVAVVLRRTSEVQS
ncbi:MAG: hypothetical protein ACJ8AK_17165 [Gemmatimonadaceae bacterium]